MRTFEIVFVLSIKKYVISISRFSSKGLRLVSSLLSVSGLRCAGGGWRGWAPTIPGTQAINSSAQTQSSSHLDPALDIYTDMQCCRYLDSIVSIYSVDITWWLVLLDMSGGLLLPESAVPSWDPTLCYSAHHGWMPVTSCPPHHTLALISTLGSATGWVDNVYYNV